MGALLTVSLVEWLFEFPFDLRETSENGTSYCSSILSLRSSISCLILPAVISITILVNDPMFFLLLDLYHDPQPCATTRCRVQDVEMQGLRRRAAGSIIPFLDDF